MSRISDVPLVVSFYTQNTPHRLGALALIASCKAFGIEAEIEGVPSEGAWDRNCAIKPFFIRKKLLEKKRPIFWVDADAVFKKVPNFSSMMHSDVSFRHMKRFSHDKRLKYFTGSLFLNYTPSGLAFADKWCDYCQQKIDDKANLEYLDQISLVHLIERGEQVKLFSMPIAYAKIFDLDVKEIDPMEVVIEHFRDSRRFRHWKG